jgi:hypothetical protein
MNATATKDAGRSGAELATPSIPVPTTKTRNAFDVELEHLMRNSSFKSPTRTMYGFFYQCYKRPRATLEVISRASTYMHGSPIYLVSSGGYHYEPLAERFKDVHFVYDDENVNLHGEGGKLDRWFSWIKAAALWCNCEYLVILEDDVHLKKPITERPPYDAGGITSPKSGFQWPASLTKQFGTNFSHHGYGMCGGSYLRVDAFLEAHARLNWTRVFEMRSASDERFGMISDMTLALVMMDSGYYLKPWDQLSQKYWKGSAEAALMHNEKGYYKAKLDRFSGKVISDQLDRNESALIRLVH